MVGSLFKESSSPSQTLRTHFYHIRFSLIRFPERGDRQSHKASFERVVWEKILRSVLFAALHQFRINKQKDPWIPKVCNFQFFSIKMFFMFYHGDLGC